MTVVPFISVTQILRSDHITYVDVIVVVKYYEIRIKHQALRDKSLNDTKFGRSSLASYIYCVGTYVVTLLSNIIPTPRLLLKKRGCSRMKEHRGTGRKSPLQSRFH